MKKLSYTIATALICIGMMGCTAANYPAARQVDETGEPAINRLFDPRGLKGMKPLKTQPPSLIRRDRKSEFQPQTSTNGVTYSFSDNN